MEAAKSITAATAALIKAAAMAQCDLVAAGMVSGQPRYHSEDGQWSEGLVSAARLVAAATHSLVEAANGLVHGEASEEKLISSAKQGKQYRLFTADWYVSLKRKKNNIK